MAVHGHLLNSSRTCSAEGGGPGCALTSEELDELRRLRREVKTLRMERDFAKKAAAYFAKDLDPRSS